MKTLMRESHNNNFQAIFRFLVISAVLTGGYLNTDAQCNNNWSGTAPLITFQLSGTAITAFSISFTNAGCFSSIGFIFSSISLTNGSFSQGINAYPNSGTITGVLSSDGNSMSGTYTINLAYLHPVYFYPVPCGTIAGNWSAVPETPRPVADAGPDIAVCTGDFVTLTATGGESYIWTGGVINGVAFKPAETNTYTVTVTAANGCTDTDDVKVTVNSCTAINDHSVPSGGNIKIYPNPAIDEFTVSIVGPESEISISILSVYGKVIYSKEHNSEYRAIFTERVDLSDHPGGVYFVRVNNGQNNYTCKLVLK